MITKGKPLCINTSFESYKRRRKKEGNKEDKRKQGDIK
jgi:hypothetical protein